MKVENDHGEYIKYESCGSRLFGKRVAMLPEFWPDLGSSNLLKLLETGLFIGNGAATWSGITKAEHTCSPVTIFHGCTAACITFHATLGTMLLPQISPGIGQIY